VRDTKLGRFLENSEHTYSKEIIVFCEKTYCRVVKNWASF
jgi:hypothetical protein